MESGEEMAILMGKREVKRVVIGLELNTEC